MCAPVILIKNGIYGEAALINSLVCADRGNVLAHWLLTTTWPGDVRNIPRQYDILTRVIPEVVDGPGPDHEIVVALLDHRMQGKRFAAIDVCEDTLDLYPPPTVIIRFTATDAQARVLVRALTSACLDGTIYPGDPIAQDWHTRTMWMAAGRAILECIKSGRHEAGAQ